jgi:hypothetical protein
LGDVDKPELRLISNESEEDASRQTAESDDLSQSFLDPPPGALGERDFDPLTENEAIERETLKILSDLVNLTSAR